MSYSVAQVTILTPAFDCYDAAGQTATNTYNARGQIPRRECQRGNKLLHLCTNGYLLTIDGPLPAQTIPTPSTYDAFGRARTVADTESYTLTYDYDTMGPGHRRSVS